ncbi:hypothetical protein IEQ_04990 [Bacillus cereus BAG6X1-2]|nr:hypothetical protein IEQ_04990 [Bacillus cereus BAG6X1-2]
MTDKNNITRNIVIFVAVGVAISMFKKENREKVKNAAATTKSKMNEISESTEIKENMQAVIEDLKETIEIFCKKKIETQTVPPKESIKEEDSEKYIELK